MAEKSNHGASWSKIEDTEVIDKHASGISIPDIAESHGRSPNAIKMRLEKLGKLATKESPGRVISTKTRPPLWTADQEAILISNREAGVPVKKIAEALGRSAGAIRSRLRKLDERKGQIMKAKAEAEAVEAEVQVQADNETQTDFIWFMSRLPARSKNIMSLAIARCGKILGSSWYSIFCLVQKTIKVNQKSQ